MTEIESTFDGFFFKIYDFDATIFNYDVRVQGQSQGATGGTFGTPAPKARVSYLGDYYPPGGTPIARFKVTFENISSYLLEEKLRAVVTVRARRHDYIGNLLSYDGFGPPAIITGSSSSFLLYKPIIGDIIPTSDGFTFKILNSDYSRFSYTLVFVSNSGTYQQIETEFIENATGIVTVLLNDIARPANIKIIPSLKPGQVPCTVLPLENIIASSYSYNGVLVTSTSGSSSSVVSIHALYPIGAVTSTSDGMVINITNYDNIYNTWSVTHSIGTLINTLETNKKITIKNVEADTDIVVTVTLFSLEDGKDRSTNFYGKTLSPSAGTDIKVEPLIPKFGELKNQLGLYYQIQITNYDDTYKWTCLNYESQHYIFRQENRGPSQDDYQRYKNDVQGTLVNIDRNGLVTVPVPRYTKTNDGVPTDGIYNLRIQADKVQVRKYCPDLLTSEYARLHYETYCNVHGESTYTGIRVYELADSSTLPAPKFTNLIRTEAGFSIDITNMKDTNRYKTFQTALGYDTYEQSDLDISISNELSQKGVILRIVKPKYGLVQEESIYKVTVEHPVFVNEDITIKVSQGFALRFRDIGRSLETTFTSSRLKSNDNVANPSPSSYGTTKNDPQADRASSYDTSTRDLMLFHFPNPNKADFEKLFPVMTYCLSNPNSKKPTWMRKNPVPVNDGSYHDRTEDRTSIPLIPMRSIGLTDQSPVNSLILGIPKNARISSPSKWNLPNNTISESNILKLFDNYILGRGKLFKVIKVREFIASKPTDAQIRSSMQPSIIKALKITPDSETIYQELILPEDEWLYNPFFPIDGGDRLENFGKIDPDIGMRLFQIDIAFRDYGRPDAVISYDKYFTGKQPAPNVTHYYVFRPNVPFNSSQRAYEAPNTPQPYRITIPADIFQMWKPLVGNHLTDWNQISGSRVNL